MNRATWTLSPRPCLRRLSGAEPSHLAAVTAMCGAFERGQPRAQVLPRWGIWCFLGIATDAESYSVARVSHGHGLN